MQILILDDDEKRQEAFAKRFRDHDIKHALNSTQAIEAFSHALDAYDLVYLDHDLEEKVNDPYPSEITGDDVARWMCEQLPVHKRPGRVIIHSWNPDGARRMGNRLRDAGFRVMLDPFKVSE